MGPAQSARFEDAVAFPKSAANAFWFTFGLFGVCHREAVMCDGLLEEEMATASELTTKVATLEERVANHIKFFWASISLGAAWLAAGTFLLLSVNSKVGEIQVLLAAQRLDKAASQPDLRTSPREAKKAVEDAIKTNTILPAKLISDAGKSFASASAKNPEAWPVLTTLMDYRSHLNGLVFVFPPTGAVPEDTEFELNPVPGKDRPIIAFVRNGVPIQDAARLEKIGKPTNPNVKVGPVHLIARGGAFNLDGWNIAHVIFFGTEVHYSGAPIILEDVLFVNCTFVFDNADRSRSLAEKITSSEFVTFAA